MSEVVNKSIGDVKERLASYRIIDVREPNEWVGELGHIVGAELVPQGQLSVAASGWDHATPLLMVCRSGMRSHRAADYLLARGFQEVFNLQGGMVAWNQQGLPVSRD